MLAITLWEGAWRWNGRISMKQSLWFWTTYFRSWDRRRPAYNQMHLGVSVKTNCSPRTKSFFENRVVCIPERVFNGLYRARLSRTLYWNFGWPRRRIKRPQNSLVLYKSFILSGAPFSLVHCTVPDVQLLLDKHGIFFLVEFCWLDTSKSWVSLPVRAFQFPNFMRGKDTILEVIHLFKKQIYLSL